MVLERSLGLSIWHSTFNQKTHSERAEIIAAFPTQFPTAALHLASIEIQRIWRGFHDRKRLRSKDQTQIRITCDAPSGESRLVASYLLWVQENGSGEESEEALQVLFFEYCATRIQSWVRMVLARQRYKLLRFDMYHIAANSIARAWRAYIKKVRAHRSNPRNVRAAISLLQRAFRRYMNVRIYRYYRDLVRMREHADPGTILQSLNPRESVLADAASGMHVRFRLGGASFPPTLYYKIYTHVGVVDINAFAPRDYVTQRRVESVSQMPDPPVDDIDPDRGWYQRCENNGWRPVAESNITTISEVGLREAERPKSFHYSKSVRRVDTERKRRHNKLRWIKKMYQEGMARERFVGATSSDRVVDYFKDISSVEGSLKDETGETGFSLKDVFDG
eukprot:1005161_1